MVALLLRTPFWEALLSHIGGRLARLEELRRQAKRLTAEVITELEAGRTGDKAASELATLVRRAANPRGEALAVERSPAHP